MDIRRPVFSDPESPDVIKKPDLASPIITDLGLGPIWDLGTSVTLMILFTVWVKKLTSIFSWTLNNQDQCLIINLALNTKPVLQGFKLWHTVPSWITEGSWNSAIIWVPMLIWKVPDVYEKLLPWYWVLSKQE